MKVELVNDLIARKIYEAASIDDKARAIASKFIKDRYTHFCRSKNMLLSRQELAFIQPYLHELVLDKKQTDYIERSKKRIQQTKKRKRLRDAGMVALVCVAVLSSWGMWERHRYTKTHQHLAMAQDSIGLLLNNARNAPRAKKYPTAPTTALLAFHTLHIKGQVTNTQGNTIEAAMIQVLGATVKSDEQGYYELHLVLPLKYWNDAPTLHVKKEYYQDMTHSLDVDKDKLEWNPVLAADN